MDPILKKTLKAKAHHLQPIILMGNKGLTDPLLAEIDLALTTHELIKIKIVALDKTERIALAKTICQNTHAEFIQLMGHIATIYRKNPEH